MQIRRYDTESHGYAQPKSALRVSGEQSGKSQATSGVSRADLVPNTAGTSDSRLAGLTARLKNLPQIRTSAVEAAREKLARGEFTTRQAAQQLAATDLRNEFF
ncbi:hypothetical protein SH661x_000562 [Planctomicrobium sp. SH661]|uniref:hypothetical protein n=1 Tax=Planctomicrobium sp. SH661 TaxID=3448124 RepID=UPI003F5BC6F1